MQTHTHKNKRWTSHTTPSLSWTGDLHFLKLKTLNNKFLLFKLYLFVALYNSNIQSQTLHERGLPWYSIRITPSPTHVRASITVTEVFWQHFWMFPYVLHYTMLSSLGYCSFCSQCGWDLGYFYLCLWPCWIPLGFHSLFNHWLKLLKEKESWDLM